MAKPIKEKMSKINAQKIIEKMNKDRAILKKEMTKEKLSQFNKEELGRLEDLLQECEDLCYEIKADFSGQSTLPASRQENKNK